MKKRYLVGLFSFEFLKTALIVVLLAFFIRYFLVQPFLVVGVSMEPNFHNNEYLLVDQVSYRFREPKRGEVVIFHPPNAPSDSYIKRIIGLPGETVEIKNGQVYINHYPLVEDYLPPNTATYVSSLQKQKTLKVTLGKDEFFVMGDNRTHSSDSREIGPIPRVNLEGRVALRVLPLRKFGWIHAPAY